MCTRVSSSYLKWTGRRGSLCGECEPPPRQGSSARTAHSRTAWAREPVHLWGREGAGATRAAPTALALPWNPSKTSPRKSLCGARQRRRKIHSPDEAMKRCISWCVSPPLECPLLASRVSCTRFTSVAHRPTTGTPVFFFLSPRLLVLQSRKYHNSMSPCGACGC